MQPARLAMLMLAATLAAHADFSYTMTQKSAGGIGVAGAAQVTKYFLKGQKMKIDHGTTTTILDFDAQTVTNIDNAAKSYRTIKFSDLPADGTAGLDVAADVKNTGQTKTIGGYQASQMLMTMEIEIPDSRHPGMKAQMEVEYWVSRDVPGAQEFHAFYKQNAARFPMAAMGAGGGDPNMLKAMAKLQRQIGDLDGVPVLEIVRVKGGAAPSLSPAQTQQMAQARAQLEAMAKQGGPQAAAMQAALARMGNPGGAAGPLMETAMEGSGYSAAALPDSDFAVPAGYQPMEK